MHFGPRPDKHPMKKDLIKIIAGIFVIGITALAIHGCKPGKPAEPTISPDAGTSYKSGDAVQVQAHVPSGTNADSIVYLLDSVRIASKKDTSAVTLKTDSIRLGARIITAKIYTAGAEQEA